MSSFVVEHRRSRLPVRVSPRADTAAIITQAVSASEMVARLRALADRARRLRPPMSNNPAAFHEDKDELASELMTLAEAFGGTGPRARSA